MRLTILSDNVIGKELAVPIYNANGSLLVNSGFVFSERSVANVKKLGVHTIYIHDGNDEVTIQEILDSSIKLKIIKMLKDEFESIKKTETVNEKTIFSVLDLLIKNINVSENAFMYNNISHSDELLGLVQHSIDVAIFTLVIGISKNFDEKKLLSLGVGALLHDIGKLFSKEKDHPSIGYKLVKANPFFTATMFIPLLQHHEHVDGTGYPEKLVGDKIYEHTKIISICNEYINILNEENMLPHLALEKITAFAMTKFDPEMIKDFTKYIYCYPNGLTVKLNNGFEGTIIMQNKGLPLRPIVMIEKGEDREYINLMENLTLFVDGVIA